MSPPPKADLPPPKADLPPPKADLSPPKADLPPPKADLPPPKADLPPPKADWVPSAGRRALPVLLLAAFLAAPLFAGPADDLLSAGRKAFTDAQYALAADSFQRVQDDYPESGAAEEAAYLLGVALFYQGRWQDSVSALSLLAVRYPRSSFLSRASYWTGAADLKLGSWQSALDSLSSFLEDPGSPASMRTSGALYRAIALEGLGRDQEAAADYRRMLAEAPSGPNAVELTYRLAGTELRAGRYASARDLYGRILLAPAPGTSPGTSPGSSPGTSPGTSAPTPFVQDAVFFTGECELALGSLAEAERRYRTVLSLYPDSPWLEASTFRLADISWRQRRPTALRQVEDFLDRFPNGTWRGSALRLRADILVDRKRTPEAVDDYQRAVGLLQGAAEKQSAFYALALAQLSLGRKADAAASLAGAGAGPSAETAEKAGYQRAVLLADLGRIPEAIDALQSFLKSFPASARSEQAGKLLGTLLEKQGDREAARTSWDWLARTFPRSASLPEYLYLRGRDFLSASRWAPALDDFQRVTRDYPGTPWSARSTYSIGYVYTRRGEYPRALPFFQAASRDPASGKEASRAALAAAICLFDMGRFEQAMTAFRSLPSPLPPDASAGTVALYIGRSLYRMGRLPEAASGLSDAAAALAAEASPLGADALYWRGWALLRQQKPAEAFSSFLAVAEGYPADPRRQEALFRAGVSKTLQGDDAAAAVLFDQVIGAPVTSGGSAAILEQAMYEKGLALSRLGRGDESSDALENLARAFPGSRLAAQAFFSRAEKAFSQQRFSDARSGFDRVAQGFPRSPLAAQAAYWSAESLLRGGDPAGAAEGFWRCLDPSSAALPAGLLSASIEGFSSALRQSSNPETAREFARKVQSVSGLAAEASAGVLLAAAEVLVAGSPGEAARMVDAAAAAAPPEPYAGEANLLLGMLAASRADWDRALDILGSLEGSRADDIGARAALEKGRALEAMGRTADAVDEYLRAAYLFPDLADRAAEGMVNAARLSRARGDLDRASKIEQALRKSYPGSPWVDKLPEVSNPAG